MSAIERQDPVDPAIQESVLLRGDLAKLTPTQKLGYYKSVCESLGLNPLTQPFAYIVLNGKEMLYAKREATEQLRKIHEISILITGREMIEGCYVVTAKATMPSGRCDESTGAVGIENLKGETRANALLKAETKAKRRVTLSICGMGMLDESEVDSIPGAKIGEQSTKLTEAPRTIAAPLPAMPAKLPTIEGALSVSLEQKPESEPSTLEQQQAFAMKFRDALPEKFRPHAEQLRRAVLKEEGYVDAEGKGTSKVILRKDFPAVAKRLIAEAAKMKEPFIASDDDLPENM